MASPVKALAEYLYIHRLNWETIEEPIESLRIDKEKLTSIQSTEIRAAIENYRNGRIKRFLEALIKG